MAKRGISERDFEDVIDDLPYWTFTITFRDQAITYPTAHLVKQYGTEMRGFSRADFDRIVHEATKRNIECQRYNLNELIDVDTPFAELLVLPNAVDKLLGAGATENLFSELVATQFNEKTMSLRNKNKKVCRHAQQSVVFATDQDRQKVRDPVDSNEYEPVVHSINDIDHASILREKIAELCDRKELTMCTAECNRYANTESEPDKCGVGPHGDQESRLVWAVRIGWPMSLWFHWFYHNEPVGKPFLLEELSPGTIYFMSKEAVGRNYKKSSIYTLRHAAGGYNYTTKPLEIRAKKKEKGTNVTQTHDTT